MKARAGLLMALALGTLAPKAFGEVKRPAEVSAAAAASGRVAIAGQVLHQGLYAVPNGTRTTLIDIIMDAGGLTRVADGSAVRVLRYPSNGMAQRWVVDVTSVLSGKTDDAAKVSAARMVLVPGDIIFVPRPGETGEPTQVESAADDRFPYIIPFRVTENHFRGADRIVIQTVRGDRPHLEVGGRYRVTGTYVLESAPEARLSISLTTYIHVGTRILPEAGHNVSQGTGEFSVVDDMPYDGKFHVSFNPAHGGPMMGFSYFAEEK